MLIRFLLIGRTKRYLAAVAIAVAGLLAAQSYWPETITALPPSVLLQKYDADANGSIEKSEVIKAINDYLSGEGDNTISKTEIIEVINLYLSGPVSIVAPNASGLSAAELRAAREYAVELVNAAREEAGLKPVTLVDAPSAQSHADDMRLNCFLSHWGSDGLKPYMRYTLAGGVSFPAENLAGFSFCPTGDGTRQLTVRAFIGRATDALLNSEGHAANILDPPHNKVSIGIALEHPNFWLVQLFIDDYLDYTENPSIEGGVLKLAGSVRDGARADEEEDLSVGIFYDPVPRRLTRGQQTRTYCSGFGKRLAALRPPPPPGYHYTGGPYFDHNYALCPDPYQVSATAPAPRSYGESDQLHGEAKRRSEQETRTDTVEWITADRWDVSNGSFSIQADVGHLVAASGDGVYTIVVWATIEGEDQPVSAYSIFVPPYTP